MPAAPLIITLALNDEAQLFFNDLRAQHFPPQLNYLKAHLTLFHHLPSNEESITETVKSICADQKKLALPITDIKHTGRGVAYRIESGELVQLHKHLQQLWKQWLIPQDRQRLWPHITVQNKVSTQQAAALQQTLLKKFVPFTVYGIGLELWLYKGGPWQFVTSFSFSK